MKRFLRYAVELLATFHGLLVIGSIASLFVCPFMLPWYAALPICVFIVHLLFDPAWICPATIWENRLRRRADMPELNGGWLNHYVYAQWEEFKRNRSCLRIYWPE